MKTKTIFILMVVLFLSACGDYTYYTIKTRIYADGSCKRTACIKTNRRNIDLSDYPIPVDSTWQFTLESSIDTSRMSKDSTGKEVPDTAYFYTASKCFSSVTAADSALKGTSAYEKLKRSIEFEKKFRWFYTFYEFKETYEKMFEDYPMSEYLTEEELVLTELNEKELAEKFDSIPLEQAKKRQEQAEYKANKWMNDSFFKEYIELLHDTLKSIKHPDLPVEKLIANKQHLREHFDLFGDDRNYDSVFYSLYAAADTNLIDSIHEKVEIHFEDRIALIFLGPDELTHELEMPGLVIESNADKVESNKLEWKILWHRYFADDFTLYTKSRTINNWAFVVSGIIVLIALFLVFRRKK